MSTSKVKKRITIDEYNKELTIALKQIKEGNTVSHADVVKQSKKWLKHIQSSSPSM